jgi:GT2 family glycosyltransferase
MQSTKSAPNVHIVILNWNNAPDTIACLESVLALDYGAYRILVVDNGSTDGSAAAIQAHYPQVELLRLAHNYGYAEGNNRGIRHALRTEPDYLFVLNNDTLVSSSMMRELVQVAEEREDIGMVGPKMYCTSPPDHLFAAGSYVRWGAGDLWHRGMFQPAATHAGLDTAQSVDFIVGCGVLVRRRMIEQIGLLDADYYLNYEDVDWGIRAHRHGFDVLYAPQAILWHKVSATLGVASPANTYYMTRNSLLFFKRHTAHHLRGLTMSRILLRTVRTITAWSVKPEYRNDRFRRKRDANLLALRDFFTKRFGAMGADVMKVCYGN